MKTAKLIGIASLLILRPLLYGSPVAFTFEEADGGSTFGVEYGSMDPQGFNTFVRSGFIIDVIPTRTSNAATHFHETDSHLNPKVPDRPLSDRGVLWRDSVAGQDPLVFTRTISTTVFSLSSLVVGSSTADNTQTTGVRVSAFLRNTLIGTVDLFPPTDAYASYAGATLGALNGLSMDRLEFIGLSNNSVSYYMLDNVVFETADAAPPSASIASYAGIQITGTVGSTYRVQYTHDLTSPTWITLADVPLPTSPYTYFDPVPINQTSRRFYRVLIAPL